MRSWNQESGAAYCDAELRAISVAAQAGSHVFQARGDNRLLHPITKFQVFL
jgi:hypothetical protein